MRWQALVPLEGVVGIAHGLDKGLAQEQGEVVVAVAGQAAAHATRFLVSRHSRRASELGPVLMNDARAAAPHISALEGVPDALARAMHVAD